MNGAIVVVSWLIANALIALSSVCTYSSIVSVILRSYVPPSRRPIVQTKESHSVTPEATKYKVLIHADHKVRPVPLNSRPARKSRQRRFKENPARKQAARPSAKDYQKVCNERMC